MAEEFIPIAADSQPFFDLYKNTSLCPTNDTCLNTTLVNVTTIPGDNSYSTNGPLEIFITGITSIVLGLMILLTVIGNVFVIAAILLEKNLQNVANYLIVSLAVADLMVACLVMPLGAVYVISKDWILGPELCDMWTSCDVLCCTASILHLVAIAVDRYWAVTDIDYIHTRNVRRIGIMILLVWAVALVVSLAPQFGWRDADYLNRINEQKCLVSQDVAYQVFATCSTFYVPLFVILILYWKIFQTARMRIRKNRTTKFPEPDTTNANTDNKAGGIRKFFSGNPFRKFKRSNKESGAAEEALVTTSALMEGQSSTTVEIAEESEMTTLDPGREDNSGARNLDRQETTAFIIGENPAASQIEVVAGPSNIAQERSSARTTQQPAGPQSHASDIIRLEISPATQPSTSTAQPYNPVQAQREKKESLEAKRERKAAKTLAIITGAFVVCWLPFFITAILTPLLGPITDHLANFILWLGYFNSTLNPVIYTIFSPEFRQAFKKILFGEQGRNPRFYLGKRH